MQLKSTLNPRAAAFCSQFYVPVEPQPAAPLVYTVQEALIGNSILLPSIASTFGYPSSSSKQKNSKIAVKSISESHVTLLNNERSVGGHGNADLVYDANGSETLVDTKSETVVLEDCEDQHIVQYTKDVGKSVEGSENPITKPRRKRGKGKSGANKVIAEEVNGSSKAVGEIGKQDNVSLRCPKAIRTPSLPSTKCKPVAKAPPQLKELESSQLSGSDADVMTPGKKDHAYHSLTKSKRYTPSTNVNSHPNPIFTPPTKSSRACTHLNARTRQSKYDIAKFDGSHIGGILPKDYIRVHDAKSDAFASAILLFLDSEVVKKIEEEKRWERQIKVNEWLKTVGR